MEVLGLQLSTGQVWMLGIVGALLSHWITFQLGAHQARTARKATAALAFRSAINAAIADIPSAEEHWGGDVDTKMRALRRAVSIAVADFKPYLSIRGQVLFETAFQKFIVQVENGIPHALNAGMIIYGQPDGAKRAKQDLMKRITILLAYAQHK